VGNNIPRNGPHKQLGVAIFTPDIVDFKPKLVRRDKEGDFILVKGTTSEYSGNIMHSHMKMGKMRPVETILRMEEGGIKKKDGE
jgi:hypothetical protein